MAKLVTVCFKDRNPEQTAARRETLLRFLATLKPDNLEPAPTYLTDDRAGCLTAIFNPAEAASGHGTSTYAGWLAPGSADWWEPGTAAPDGSYALIRSDAAGIELVADALASRTLWYAHSPEIFVASTTQRAVTWLLQRFALDREAAAWMLSSGVLGPGKSWNQHVHAVPADGRVYLDRDRWSLRVSEARIEFRPEPLDRDAHLARLRTAVDAACSDLHLDFGRWVLPLSGGNDSRGVLLSIRRRDGLRCITWGLASALGQPGTDATVAREVARYLKLPHEYFETDLGSQDAETVLARFLHAGEGRNDHLSGYADGFDLWRRLANEGVRGIIRGDHPFGHQGIETTDQARFRSNMMRWSDFSQHPALASLGVPDLEMTEFPEALRQRDGESIYDWRDRVFQQFRASAVFASLNELKAAYTEIANPLLCRPLVLLARSLPPELRTSKALWRMLVKERDIPVPHADVAAVQDSALLFDSAPIKSIVLDEIGSQHFRTLTSPAFSDYILNSVALSSGSTARLVALRRARRKIKRMLPTLTRKITVRPNWRSLPASQLALRAYLMSRMTVRLESDARQVA